MLATGDLQGHVSALKRALKSINYVGPLDEVGCVVFGRPSGVQRRMRRPDGTTPCILLRRALLRSRPVQSHRALPLSNLADCV
jgi:hypothetical protein